MQDVKMFFKKVFKVPILLVFIIICITLLPSAINLRSIAFRAAIVVALGIDIDDNNNYVIDAVITIPSISDNLNENNKIISSKGTSIVDALGNMNLVFGHAIRLGHTRFIVIGNKLSMQNVALAIDGIIRTNKIRDSVQLLMCEDSVHELFNIGIELKSKTGIRISDIICHTESYSTTSFDSNVDSFYKGYFSASKISKLNSLNLTDDYTIGITPMIDAKDGGGLNSGDSQGNQFSGEQKNKFISNMGRTAIYKEGKLIDVLSSELASASNWTNGSYMQKKLLVNIENIEHITKICYDILDKSVIMEAFFLKNVPMYCVKINLTLDVNEIINKDSEIISKNSNIIEERIKADIGREVRNQVGMAVNYSKTKKLDILGINNYFNLNLFDEYNNFLKNKTPEEFLEEVQINIDVNVKII